MNHLIVIQLVVSLVLVSSANIDTLYFKTDKTVCPGGQSSCDDESTCCQLPNSEWSCCVYAHAQCCSDHLHCCPQGSTCDVKNKSCRSTSGNYTIPAVQTKRYSSQSSITKMSNTASELVKLTCPDRSICPYAGAACCRQYTGRYSCCNYPLNVCCDDGLHCCHVGTVCDPIRLVCIPYPSGDTTFTHSWIETTPARLELNVDVSQKDDSRKTCPDGHTCCLNKQGKQGLCVLDGNESVCCEDGVHCCPKGTTCDAVKRQCLSQKTQSPVTQWSSKTHLQLSDRVADKLCPDGDSECPDGNTCCQVSGNRWGCCPLTSAVCCPDMKHCCPYGTHCTSRGTCETNIQSARIPWSSLVFDEK